MATRPNKEYNQLLKLKKLMARINEDIRFLKLCLLHGVTPKSHEIRIRSSIPGARDQRMKMERTLVKKSIAVLYGKLNDVTLRSYSAHLQLATQQERKGDLYETIGKVQTAYQCEKLRKRRILTRKLRNLRSRTQRGPPNSSKREFPREEMLPDFVINKSSVNFTKEQLGLLNKGLNFAIRTPNHPVEEVIADIEAAIKFNREEEKTLIRAEAEKTIKAIKDHASPSNSKTLRIIKELNSKPVYYLKADKGNKIVIMDKDSYDNQVLEKLQNGAYRELRMNPLPESLKRIDRTLRECADVLGDNEQRVRMPNPSVPRIKCLPKIHKPGGEMREIIAATNGPTQKLAAWLLKEFTKMGQASTRSVKNYQEVVRRIQEAESIGEEDVMVSFDIKALFPSIPVQETLVLLEEWLLKQGTGTNWKYKARKYVKLAKLCMIESYFTFRGKYYKSTGGVAMGNPLSGFLSEIFLEKLEEGLQAEGMLPRVYIRYVDDVFAILDREEVEETLRELNARHPKIRFTMEVEDEGKLPFLDLIIKRNGSSLGFEIYRKPTHTQRFIPKSSNHPIQHKMAAFSSMIHRLLNVPLSSQDFEKEKKYILDTAQINGYQSAVISKRIEKLQKEKRKHQLTTLYQQHQKENQNDRRVPITYDKEMTGKIKKAFEKIGVETAPTSRPFQLKTLLRSAKDKKVLEEKSGIYSIVCPHCSSKYIGQTRRLVTTRFKEHISEAKVARERGNQRRSFRSTVAKHIVEQGHAIDIGNLSMKKEINDRRKLDFYESLMIWREDRNLLMNEEKGCCDTPLFKFLN